MSPPPGGERHFYFKMFDPLGVSNLPYLPKLELTHFFFSRPCNSKSNAVHWLIPDQGTTSLFGTLCPKKLSLQCDNALIFWLTEIHITIIQFYKDEGGKRHCLVTVIKLSLRNNEESGELNKLDFNILTRATICYENGEEVDEKDQVFPQIRIPQFVICCVPLCAW